MTQYVHNGHAGLSMLSCVSEYSVDEVLEE